MANGQRWPFRNILLSLRAVAALAPAMACRAAGAAGMPMGHDMPAAQAGAAESRWDFFTNFGQYMSRVHCMRLADGTPDWPWIIASNVLTAGVVIAYLRIFIFWRKAYLEVPAIDRNKKLMDMAHVFFWCALCGYVMSMVMFAWPAYRLLALLLGVLNFFSWRFAWNLGDLRVSFSAKALQRRLTDTLRTRNEELELLVADKTAALRVSEAHALDAARTDRLTGLPNRIMLLDRLQQAILRSQRMRHYHFAVLFIDFDRFKMINDSLGHQAGDKLLIELAGRLASLLRASDSISPQDPMAARLGGDEFVILLDGLNAPGDVCIVADRIQRLIAKPFRLGEQDIYTTASIGIVTSALAGGSADEVLRDADTAMYEAKAAGKGRYMVFDKSMRERVNERLSIETDLQRALLEGQIFVEYQPIVSLTTGQLESVEALVRWRHPQRGIVGPADFVPIAEETGIICAIGEWVLREACTQFGVWRMASGPRAPHAVSVNVSRRQLLTPGFVETVRDVLAATHMAPQHLHLEITESHMMLDAARAIAVLKELHALGIKIDMDDFGTGYSSLACLRQFPLDVLKIDRTFVASLGEGRDLTALVHAVAQLARNMGIKVVAEGIETYEQLVLLQSLECDFGQGYYFARPMSAERITDYVPARTNLAAMSA